ncbi:MAG: FecR domain-containing protein [Deltaproteobacteria bacterium]|nr:FecR domain-containing protein [Deltaproteobacteria bacterium]
MRLLAKAGVSACIGLVAAVLAPTIARGAAPEAAVTFLSGQADGGPEGKLRPLKMGAKVRFGDHVRTAKDTRLELTLPDGSRVRLAGETEVKLTRAGFEGRKRESVSLRLLAGRLWASVVRATGGKDTFEVETANAVSGVRGTSFAVLAASDTSALVRVYSGSVGVRPSAAKAGPRREVPGPQEIDRRQWEEIIATAMKQVRVSAAGDIAPAEDFEDSGDSLEWAKWNQGRDAKSGTE